MEVVVANFKVFAQNLPVEVSKFQSGFPPLDTHSSRQQAKFYGTETRFGRICLLILRHHLKSNGQTARNDRMRP
jgi:hypothetical protein